MKDFSYITNSHPAYIDNLYHDFVANPENTDPELRKFFEGYDFAVGNSTVNGSPNGLSNGQSNGVAKADTQSLEKEFSVYKLIQAYRKKGHLVAKTNPIRERKD